MSEEQTTHQGEALVEALRALIEQHGPTLGDDLAAAGANQFSRVRIGTIVTRLVKMAGLRDRIGLYPVDVPIFPAPTGAPGDVRRAYQFGTAVFHLLEVEPGALEVAYPRTEYHDQLATLLASVATNLDRALNPQPSKLEPARTLMPAGL